MWQRNLSLFYLTVCYQAWVKGKLKSIPPDALLNLEIFSVIWHTLFGNEYFIINRYSCAYSKYNSFFDKSIVWKFLIFETISSLFNTVENQTFIIPIFCMLSNVILLEYWKLAGPVEISTERGANILFHAKYFFNINVFKELKY